MLSRQRAGRERGRRERGGKQGLRGYISGGKPVWVAMMNRPSACVRGPDDQRGRPSSKEVTSPSRRDLSLYFVGQWRIAYVKDSESEPQRGQVSLGSSLHQEG